ncbi:MAG: DUF5103 domain-containing protein [Porphyromonas sp.]|nr:DUF5103 domain-containing protein [Porphyromonas sp.]
MQLRDLFLMGLCGLGIQLTEAQPPSDFDGRVGAVSVSVGGRTQRQAVLRLGSTERLTLELDVLGTEGPELGYRLRHTEPDGSPSSITSMEALSGFDEQDIPLGKLVHQPRGSYYRYRFSLPNEQIRFRLSGRYQLEVFRLDNPDDKLVSLPIYVSEDKASIAMNVISEAWGKPYGKYQGVELSLSLGAELSTARLGELWIELWQNATTLLPCQRFSKPSAVEGATWYYRGAESAIFWGGSDYHVLDLRSEEGVGEGIAHTKRHDGLIELYTSVQEDRRGKPYVSMHKPEGWQSMTSEYTPEGEYRLVHFALRSPEVAEGSYILDSPALDHISLEERRLRYDATERLYRLSLPLKQGLLSYRYIYLPAEGSEVDSEPLEGSYTETPNVYTALVYYRPPGARYTRLVGG